MFLKAPRPAVTVNWKNRFFFNFFFRFLCEHGKLRDRWRRTFEHEAYNYRRMCKFTAPLKLFSLVKWGGGAFKVRASALNVALQSTWDPVSFTSYSCWNGISHKMLLLLVLRSINLFVFGKFLWIIRILLWLKFAKQKAIYHIICTCMYISKQITLIRSITIEKATQIVRYRFT